MGASDVVIRPLRADDFPAADRVRRLAFGTFFGLADPMTFRGDRAPDRTRFLADPTGSFAAELDGELVGTNFAVNWGSVGLLGPIAVHPKLWNRGIAQRLIRPVMETFERRGIRHAGLFTLAQSPKHIALYQKFGFWPRYLTVIMSKPVDPTAARAGWLGYSELPAAQQNACLDACRGLTDAVYDGLDLSVEIGATHQHRFGETLLRWEGDQLVGFAVCHCEPQTEAGSDSCYVKFGAIRPGPEAPMLFAQLLKACEGLAAERGQVQLLAGVNTVLDGAIRDVRGHYANEAQPPAFRPSLAARIQATHAASLFMRSNEIERHALARDCNDSRQDVVANDPAIMGQMGQIGHQERSDCRRIWAQS